MNLLGNAWGQRITLLVIVFAVMAVFQQKFFLPANALSILLAIAIYGIMAGGMLFTVLVGGMDLSMGSMAAFAAAIMCTIAEKSAFSTPGFLLGFAAAIAMCVLVGFLHGCFVTHFGMPAFIVTLATKYILYGVVQLLTNGAFIYPSGRGIVYQLGNAKILGIPMPVVFFVLVAVLCAVVLGRTTYGRRLYAIGGNVRSSKLVGIKGNLNIKVAYIISSVSAGLGGMILASMNMQSGTTTASGYEGNVLMAMVVGGINLAGGEGGIPGAIFGALLVGIINNVMTLLGVGSDFQKFVQGVIILAAVSLNIYTKRKSAGLTEPQRRVKKVKKITE
jgi:ribose/xylose/arabinose/galactoside ABC-type transport system permease subunit